jgi:hypothetical protein
MNRTEILNSLKNNVYEFEGLLELLTARSEKSADLLPLLSVRLTQITAIFDALEADVKDTPAPLANRSVDEEPIVDESVVETSIVDTPVLEAPVAETPIVATPVVETPVQRKAPAFCLNDRFRFRRNVFGGDVTLFDKVCDRVTRMKDYDEAEQYFFGELGLDASDSDVEDFMTIIREYFGK